MKNREITQIFENIATLFEIREDNVFKIRAYRKAAENLQNTAEDVKVLLKEGRLSQLPGIGKALQEKIAEYVTTGKIHAYEKLKKELPESLLGVVQIPSVGPKKAGLFFKELKVKSVADLAKALDGKKIKNLPGIQQKTLDNIKRGIRIFYESQSRMDIVSAVHVSESIIKNLKKLKEVRQICVAGSLRRMRETVRDVDILVDSSNPSKVMERFVSLPMVKHINSKGTTKSSIVTDDNIQVDLRVVAPKSFGAALLYFTGSKYFNVRLRQYAIRKKMKVNEYGLFSVTGKSERYLAGKTEKEMFEKLGLSYLEPELREDIGSAELFRGSKPPQLIQQSDIKGDLHVHSTWSDGRSTIEEFAVAAKKRGYEYIAIADHSQQLRVAGGLSRRDLIKKKKEIDAVNKKMRGLRVLFATEVEIDANGDIDYNNKILSEFDFVIAAIHSGFEQPSKRITRRIIRACRNKHVHAIAHPTCVHLGKRDPVGIDLDEVCTVAVDTNTFLEINSFPFRLDLNSANAYFAGRHGAKIVVNTDAHAIEHLDFMRFGVGVARRGWLSKADVINTLNLKDLLKALDKR